MHRILSRQTVSISELKKNPAAVIEAADGEAVAILVHNRPSAYLVPADTYQRMLDRLEDAELAAIVRSRKTERTVKVKLDEL
ncbi:MAG TPA: type II toxin-antitoxin system prevent-host-death family antitoxin [Rhodanobacteraceae bacterium]|nr:type II toxin-antitoxin system prevent-host-death family antitoxin [Rhodanobacteraceae bacterium]